MSIIHVQQIKAYLQATFGGRIDLSDCVGMPEDQRESLFLTRALAAFSLQALGDLEPDQAAADVTDGPQDNGIDAIHFDPAEQVLYLAQAKWRHDGTGSLERAEVLKFTTGVNDLLNARFDRFNTRIQARADDIQAALYSAQTRFQLVVAYTGQDPLAVEPQRDLDDFLKDMNDPSDVMQIRVLRQGGLHGIIARGAKGAPINLEVVLKSWGQTREPYKSYYGQVAASDIAGWWERHHPRLFAPNLRMFLGLTDVNQALLDTLRQAPEHFWYFNNGVTALCTSIVKKPLGGDSREMGIFECTDVSIVNGAQTVGAIAAACATHPAEVAKASVIVRFISLENCPEGIATEITRATNTQNRTERRDFVSLDPEQERLRTELQLDGVTYVYKSGDRTPAEKDGFDLVEATVALACSQKDISLAVQAKREIGKLWEDISKAPYRALFNSSLTGLRVWQLVQAVRVVEGALKREQKSRQGRAAMFAVHGNRAIAYEVLRRLDLSDAETAPSQSSKDKWDALTVEALNWVTQAASKLYPDSYLASLFKNLSKCRKVSDRVGELWPPG